MPARIIAARSAFVALKMRTFTWRSRLDPRRWNLSGLEHTQELHLSRERQIADLVEESACRRRPLRHSPRVPGMRRYSTGLGAEPAPPR